MVFYLPQADIKGFLFPYPVFFQFLRIFFCRLAHNRFQRGYNIFFCHFPRRNNHFSVLQPAGRFHNGKIPFDDPCFHRIEIIYLGCFFKSYTYNCRHLCHSFRNLSILRAMASITSLPPALLSRARYASFTASRAFLISCACHFPARSFKSSSRSQL